jgi:hypothetical protein
MPLFHCLFLWVMLIEDAVSWLLILCLSHTNWSICSFTYTHVPLFCFSEHSSLAHLSALLVELSNNWWTLFWPVQNSLPAVIRSTFYSLWLLIAFFLWMRSANRAPRWVLSLFYHCCSENVYQLFRNEHRGITLTSVFSFDECLSVHRRWHEDSKTN